MPQRALSLAVVGANHANKKGPTRRFAISLCRPGDPVVLKPEPKNAKDERAIAVFSREGVQMGYLTAERAPWVGAMLKQGREVQVAFQRSTQWGCWIRAAFDGERPSVEGLDATPGENEERENDQDWYPDEVYPDE